MSDGLQHDELSSHSEDSSISLEDTKEKYLDDIPLPKILTRHLLNPSRSLQDQGGVMGMRFIFSARVGGKSGKITLGRGKIGAKSFDLSNVDYGKSFYVEKLGVSGLKAWVSYRK